MLLSPYLSGQYTSQFSLRHWPFLQVFDATLAQEIFNINNEWIVHIIWSAAVAVAAAVFKRNNTIFVHFNLNVAYKYMIKWKTIRHLIKSFPIWLKIQCQANIIWILFFGLLLFIFLDFLWDVALIFLLCSIWFYRRNMVNIYFFILFNIFYYARLMC